MIIYNMYIILFRDHLIEDYLSLEYLVRTSLLTHLQYLVHSRWLTTESSEQCEVGFKSPSMDSCGFRTF